MEDIPSSTVLGIILGDRVEIGPYSREVHQFFHYNSNRYVVIPLREMRENA
jgi:hypothetical protein